MPATMYDAAAAPHDFGTSPWGGYLESPDAAVAWTREQLTAAMHAGGLLPIWVTPLTKEGFAAANAARDAENAVQQVQALHGDRLVVCADLEERAYRAATNQAVDYLRLFNETVRRAGGVTVFYSSADCLHVLHQYVTDGFPWVAFWTENLKTYPVPGWPKPRGWQCQGNVVVNGHGVDVSRLEDGFPLIRPRGAADGATPLSRRHRNMTKKLYNAFMERTHPLTEPDMHLVSGLEGAASRIVELKQP